MSDGHAPAHLFVLFGATGDLARRKLLPAMYRLSEAGLLAGRWAILGVARKADMDDERYRAFVRESLAEAGVEGDLGSWCSHCVHYQRLDDDSQFGDLAQRIDDVEREHGLPGNRLFYLALPPHVFASTVQGLGEVGLNESRGFTRLVVEKPIGHDLASAEQLENVLRGIFREDQIFRIDHYLGKETVQNLLVLRFGNAIFESLWTRERIENVQITVAEDLGVEDRAGYYDQSGALRDMIQNHLTQLLALIAMEVPVAYDAEAVRSEKIKVLRSIRDIEPDDVVRGQYTRKGDVPGYTEAEGVPDESTTDTFAAVRLFVDNWRWYGTPFYLRTGKRLPRKTTQVAITFRRPPVQLFRSMRCYEVSHDALILQMQPNEGFELYFDVKRPGEPMRLERVPLGFEYAERFEGIPDAYVTLLLDALEGDQTLFVHHDEVVASWRLYDPLVKEPAPAHPYEAGSWGPRDADVLCTRHGHEWMTR